MASYRLVRTVKVGGEASLDEFAEKRWSVWEEARAGAKEIEPILRKRYPKADVRLHVTEWDGTFGDSTRPRAVAQRAMEREKAREALAEEPIEE